MREANIELSPQGSVIYDIDEALKIASKSKTGNIGYPEYCGVEGDFIIVIEDKASIDKQIKRNDKDLICLVVKSVKESYLRQLTGQL